MVNPRTITFTAIPDLPEFVVGDDISRIVYDSTVSNGISIRNKDIFVVAQKIVSKAEGRLVNLTTVKPGRKALEVSQIVEKRAELVELILQESNDIVRMRPGTIIVEHKSGFICANAGIDHSNVPGLWGDPNDWVLLLPENADKSAQSIRKGLQSLTGYDLGVLIIDSYGRAWRNGIIGMSIGLAGVPALVDMRGKPDRLGYSLKVTVIAAADELAAGASLLMGQASEGTPVILVHGFPYDFSEDQASRLIRERKYDLFR